MRNVRSSKVSIVAALVVFAAITWGTPVRPPYRPALNGAHPGLTRRDLVRNRSRTIEPVGPRTPGRLEGEFQIDTAFGLARKPERQGLVACASDGEQYLAVWEDDLGGRHLTGARVTAKGRVLDPLGFAITRPAVAPSPAAPSVVFAGSEYLVVWSDAVNRLPAILGCRVTLGGIVLDSTPIRISNTPQPTPRAAAASDGRNSLVVWQNSGVADSATIYGVRVGPGGILLDSVPFPIPETAAAQAEPAITFTGNGYFVVWSATRDGSGKDILGVHLDTAGAVVDSQDIVISDALQSQDEPCVAFDGVNCLVTWRDKRTSNHGDIYGTRVTADGRVLEPAGIAICSREREQQEPALTFNRTRWLVTWGDGREGMDIYGARVNSDGTVVDPEGYPIKADDDLNWRPAICADSSGCCLAACEDGDVWAVRLDAAGAVVDTTALLLSSAFAEQFDPFVASDGANYLVAWCNEAPTDSRVCAGRIDPAGRLLDTSRLEPSAPHSGYFPVVAFGEDYLVVWGDMTDPDSFTLRASRITAAGTIRDPGGFGIGPQDYLEWSMAAASNGVDFLTTWDAQIPSSGCGVYASRVSADGTVLGSVLNVATDSMHDSSNPAVASNGSDYLVAWADFNWPAWSWSVRAARISSQGVLRDTGGIFIADDFLDYPFPAVASDGTNWLVAWSAIDNSNTCIVRANRVSPAGVLLPPYRIGIALPGDSSSGVPACATFNGENFIVTWQREYLLTGQASARATVISRQGIVIDSMQITAISYPEFWIPTAAGPGRQALSVFAVVTDSVNHQPAERVRVWGKLSEFAGIAEQRVTKRRWEPAGAVVRNVLYLPAAPDSRHPALSHLFDVSGHRVMGLHPGDNDIRRLSSGVYFVQGCQPGAVTKVVVGQ